jgi:predicted RecB family nuclease
MQRDGANLVFSPRDLIAYLDGDFSAWMERRQFEIDSGRAVTDGVNVHGVSDNEIGPDANDEETELVHRKGREHESAFFNKVRGENPGAIVIGESGDPLANTLAAMQSGAGVIYQGRLCAEGLFGIPDFLYRTPGPSTLGDFHYEPHDTKLAKSAKPHFIVQLCAYAMMLESMQGRRPERFAFVSGKGDVQPFVTDEFIYYFRRLLRAFLSFQKSFDHAKPPMPANQTSAGRWCGVAGRILAKADHLSRVAGIAVGQVKRLNEAGIFTLTALAHADERTVPRMAPETFARLRRQAQAQVRTKDGEKPYFEVLPPPPGRPRSGLVVLPPPSPLDVFFDMEGFPLVEDGLEYLFGASYFEGGERRFVDWWAHDREQERIALEGFVDWAHARRQLDPAMHIYHYANYETTALRKLMGKHGSREDKIDDLLRNNAFVDLYRIVQQGLVIGTSGYSLKDIECLYQSTRGGAVSTAGGSIVAYQKWLDSDEPQDWRSSKILGDIRDYNREDCDSLIGLRDWLIQLRKDQGWEYIPESKAAGQDEQSEKPKRDETILADKLLTEVRAGAIADSERKRIQELLAHLLEHHWREAKPVFWRMFDRHEMSEQRLFEDLDCLAGLVRTESPRQKVKQSWTYEYQFDPDQDTKLAGDAKCLFSHDLNARATVAELNPRAGIATIKLGPKAPEPPPRLALIPDEYVSASTIAQAIRRYVESWSRGEIPSRAVDDLLHRRAPRVKNHSGGRLIPNSGELTPSVIDLVHRLDQTTLCIQGPPGSGKTYICAAVIAQLLKQGKTLGVTALSHKAILNVLQMVARANREAGVTAQLFKVGDDGHDSTTRDGSISVVTPEKVESLVVGPVVIAGTAWLFSRPELTGKFDYLFIDEAGQFSLANAVAVGQSAANLVLIGDQMQLAQPIQGSHPGESGHSALDYLLNEKATIPPELGVFLDRTRRLHPDLCRFISAAVYENRLAPHDETHNRRLILPDAPKLIRRPTGIAFVHVDHDGNTQCSDEEIEIIQKLVVELRECRLAIREDEQPMSLNDILFVAPYNMQVRKLQTVLGDNARVGSVDKFQGQEAPVVVISMCASSLEDCPRGAEFLLNPNRLNVALSRAQCLAIIVGSPALAVTRCTSIEQMRLVNLYCRLMEYCEVTGSESIP